MFDYTPEEETLQYVSKMVKRFNNAGLFIKEVVGTKE